MSSSYAKTLTNRKFKRDKKTAAKVVTPKKNLCQLVLRITKRHYTDNN